jgi:hypothetical protein
MEYFINGIFFKTKKSIEDYVKNILYAGNIGDPVKGDDFEFMICFFEMFHHEWIIKKGCGINNLFRIKQPIYNKYRSFFIVRTDGSTTDISYKISKIQKENTRKDFNNALRNAIKNQITEFRNNVFSKSDIVKCPFTGEVLSIFNSHVDHFEPSFEDLVQIFIDKHNITNIENLISIPADNQTSAVIIDESIKVMFEKFHRETAKLRVLSIKGNLSHAKSNKK